LAVPPSKVRRSGRYKLFTEHQRGWCRGREFGYQTRDHGSNRSGEYCFDIRACFPPDAARRRL
jgi:hypothetical protein